MSALPTSPTIAPLDDAQWAHVLDDDSLSPCPGVTIEKHRVFAEATDDRPELYLNIWRPTEPSDTPRPALLHFHGGGYCGGNPDGSGNSGKALALALGIVTIAPSYRLGTVEKPVYPGIVHDGALVWQWVHEHAEELGINPQRIAVGGSSAGCLLAGHLAVNHPEIADSIKGFPKPAALIANWGPLDFIARWFDNGENNGSENNLFGAGGYPDHIERYHYASPSHTPKATCHLRYLPTAAPTAPCTCAKATSVPKPGKKPTPMKS